MRWALHLRVSDSPQPPHICIWNVRVMGQSNHTAFYAQLNYGLAGTKMLFSCLVASFPGKLGGLWTGIRKKIMQVEDRRPFSTICLCCQSHCETNLNFPSSHSSLSSFFNNNWRHTPQAFPSPILIFKCYQKNSI